MAITAIMAIMAITAITAINAITAITAIMAITAITAITAIMAIMAIDERFCVLNRLILCIYTGIPFIVVAVNPVSIFFFHFQSPFVD